MARILQQAILRWGGTRVWNACRLFGSAKPKLLGAYFRDADLNEADLRDANLRRADLSGAKLRSARLSGARLSRAELRGSDLNDADLSGAHLRDTDLRGATIRGAHLRRGYLRGARFIRADLSDADLRDADLSGAQLSGANLRGADLRATHLGGADLSGALLYETVLGNVDLTATKGLDHCHHNGPSIVDHRTFLRSKNVPLSFWRGCGLPDQLIEYMPSLTSDAIQFYSCFISYSSKDQEFADRLYADLQNAGVRCWFAPHDLPIGAKTWDGIDEAIRTRDKVLLILSDSAIASDWVEDEVTAAFEEERKRKKLMLFPVRLDDAVTETHEPWAGKLRANRNIGDFSRWKDHDAYKATFERALRDLKAER